MYEGKNNNECWISLLHSEKLQTSPERLAMNQGDGYRQVQEERWRAHNTSDCMSEAFAFSLFRTQIDRAIPPLDYGKGCE